MMSFLVTEEEQEFIFSLIGGSKVQSFEQLAGGINSCLVLVKCCGSQSFVFKKYRKDENRDRFQSEIKFLDYVNNFSQNLVPEIKGTNRLEGWSLLTFLDGEKRKSLSKNDVEHFVVFQKLLDKNKESKGGLLLDDAADACLSAGELCTQIFLRFEKFKSISNQERALDAFLENTLRPITLEAIEIVKQGYSHIGIDFEEKIPKSMQTVIASDFGSHNALRRNNGDFCFLDFEFAGWDDPITAIHNFVLHPGMENPEKVNALFETKMLSYFGDVKATAERYRLLRALFVIRWSLIMLNGFLLLEKKPDDEPLRLKAYQKLDAAKKYLFCHLETRFIA